MKTNNLQDIEKLLKEKAEEHQHVKKMNAQLAEQRRVEKEKHKAELKAAKKAYKESLQSGENRLQNLASIHDAYVTQERERREEQALFNYQETQIGSLNKESRKNRRLRIKREMDERHVPGYKDPEILGDRFGQKKTQVKGKIPKRKVPRRHESSMRIEEQRKQWIEKLHAKESKSEIADVSSNSSSKSKPQHFVISDEFPLQWDTVQFYDGQIIIRPFVAKVHRFTPFNQIVLQRTEARKSFNYLRTYFQEKLPKIMCYTHSIRGLVIVDTIKLDSALTILRRFEREAEDIEVVEDGAHSNSKFNICCDRGKKLTDEEFKKYKSQFIDYLVSSKRREIGVIPCLECLRYEMSKETYEMEDAFMFILTNFDGTSTIVYENLNVDRSTLLFKIERGKDMEAARQIFTFLNGMDINKRSSLRSQWVKMKGHGVKSYKSINHTDIWDWKSNLSNFMNGWN